MTRTVYDVACSECGDHTTVVERYWPATRYDPADGEHMPEECECGHHFGREDVWSPIGPDEDAAYDLARESRLS